MKITFSYNSAKNKNGLVGAIELFQIDDDEYRNIKDRCAILFQHCYTYSGGINKYALDWIYGIFWIFSKEDKAHQFHSHCYVGGYHFISKNC